MHTDKYIHATVHIIKTHLSIAHLSHMSRIVSIAYAAFQISMVIMSVTDVYGVITLPNMILGHISSSSSEWMSIIVAMMFGNILSHTFQFTGIELSKLMYEHSDEYGWALSRAPCMVTTTGTLIGVMVILAINNGAIYDDITANILWWYILDMTISVPLCSILSMFSSTGHPVIVIGISVSMVVTKIILYLVYVYTYLADTPGILFLSTISTKLIGMVTVLILPAFVKRNADDTTLFTGCIRRSRWRSWYEPMYTVHYLFFSTTLSHILDNMHPVYITISCIAVSREITMIIIIIELTLLHVIRNIQRMVTKMTCVLILYSGRRIDTMWSRTKKACVINVICIGLPIACIIIICIPRIADYVTLENSIPIDIFTLSIVIAARYIVYAGTDPMYSTCVANEEDGFMIVSEIVIVHMTSCILTVSMFYLENADHYIIVLAVLHMTGGIIRFAMVYNHIRPYIKNGYENSPGVMVSPPDICVQ